MAAGEDVDGAWKSLVALAGTWEGTYEATGDHATLTYELMSGGTVVQERMSMPKPQPDMVTMYHRDGKGLVATHYCSMGNQPRMRSEGADGKTIRFRFADITNLAAPEGGHIRHLTMRFVDGTHLEQDWTSREKGKEQTATFKWVRKK
jgi:hypothetical protein